jgi:uncharacterized membrane-anchored protein YhcB (DUF1043 family)
VAKVLSAYGFIANAKMLDRIQKDYAEEIEAVREELEEIKRTVDTYKDTAVELIEFAADPVG